jgi:N-methylhydantoinase B
LDDARWNRRRGAAVSRQLEIDELAHPIRILEQRLVPDSEGPGRHRGAPAALIEYGPVKTSLEVMFASDGSRNAARGARGGRDGRPATQQKRLRDGRLVELDAYTRVVLEPEETVVSTCCSGGGYGDARGRDRQLVQADVAEGLVSRERAAEVYGVVVTDDGAVDERATSAARGDVA